MDSIVPGAGNKTTAKRVRELEQRAGTMPVIFALLFTEAIKSFIGRMEIPFIHLPSTYKFLIASLVVAVLYIYEDERKEATSKAKDAASEGTKKAAEKAKDVKDKASDND
jgi:hypothetical protein